MWQQLQKRMNLLTNNLTKCGHMLDTQSRGSDLLNAVQDRERERERERDEADCEEESLAAKSLHNAQSWLQGSQYDQGDDIEELLDKCHPGSCDWMHDHPKLKSWLQNGREHPVLWLKGIPGSGKSRHPIDLVAQSSEVIFQAKACFAPNSFRQYNLLETAR